MDTILIAEGPEIATTVLIGAGVVRDPEAFGHAAGRRWMVLTQPPVRDLANAVAAVGAGTGREPSIVVLPDREAAKSIRVVEDTYLRFNELGVTRGDVVVAVGGGALTDAAGFVAATYLRGLDVVYVPTTLLAAVDAAIGGKTGINVDGKNLAGVFRHPDRVLIDLEVMEGLPLEILREGSAEAVKAGFIADPKLIALYEDHGLAAPLSEVVHRAVAVKAEVVSADFREGGLRAVLNYGHTVGHAVETLLGMPHGHAISVGMTAAAEVSRRLVGFEGGARQRAVLDKLGLPVVIDGARRSDVRALMDLDKKRDASGLRMVLLEDFARPVVRSVDDATVDAALGAIGLE